jgi:hypothetical protein
MGQLFTFALMEARRSITIRDMGDSWYSAMCSICGDEIGEDGGIVMPEMRAYCRLDMPVDDRQRAVSFAQCVSMIALSHGKRLVIKRWENDATNTSA